MLEEADLTEDGLLGGTLRLLQPRRGHRAGTDAVLLAGLAPIAGVGLLADLGAGTGAAGLMIGLRAPGARIVLVERAPDLAALCRRNIALNGLEARAEAVEADIFGATPELVGAGLPVGRADLVLTNPPFFEAGQARSSPEPRRRSAHLMENGSLADWCVGAARLLKPRGRLAMIHRADALGRCLAALAPCFGSVELRPIYPKAGEPASRLFIGAVKGGGASPLILPPLTLHEADGRFTPDTEELHLRGGPT